jgi:DNA repair protein RadC
MPGEGGKVGDGPPPKEASASADKPHYINHRQRLRQRFLANPAETIAEYELLELLLFYSIDRVDVKPLAKRLLDDFKTLPAVLAADPEQLKSRYKANERTLALFKAVRESGRRMVHAEAFAQPVISSWSQLNDYCRAALADEATERFHVLFLNRKNRLIADERQQEGTVDQAPVYPREVMKRALELGASALILVHNHPSGDATPSQADIDITRLLIEAGKPLDIAIHDHIIVARGGNSSLRALGYM